MEKFKKQWEIQNNWQLLFPFFGIVTIGYSAFKISNALLKTYGIILILLVSIIVFFLLLKLTLFLFKKLEEE